MGHVVGKLLFALIAATFAVGSIWGVWWWGQQPRETPHGDLIGRGREPLVLCIVIGAVFTGAIWVVLATWPTQ